MIKVGHWCENNKGEKLFACSFTDGLYKMVSSSGDFEYYFQEGESKDKEIYIVKKLEVFYPDFIRRVQI